MPTDGELADSGGYSGIAKDRRPGYARRNLLEQLQPFRAQTVFELHKAGGVAARPRQTIDDAGADWIRSEHEHDRYGASCLKQPLHGPASRKYDVRREGGQFRRMVGNAVGIARAPAILDPHILPISPAHLLERLQERPNPGLPHRIVLVAAHEYADAPHPV